MLLFPQRIVSGAVIVVPPTIDENIVFLDNFDGPSLADGWTQISSSMPTVASFADGKMTFKPDYAGTGATGLQGFGYKRNDVPATGGFFIDLDFSSNDVPDASFNYSGLWVASTSDNQGFFVGRSTTFDAFIAIGFNYSESSSWSYSGWNVGSGPLRAGTNRVRITWDVISSVLCASILDSVTGLWRTFHVRSMARPDRYGIGLQGNSIHAHHTQTNERIEIIQRGTGIVSASSQLNSDNIPAYAFDARFDRGWHNAGTGLPDWLQIEKSNSTYVGRYAITSADFRFRDPKSWRLDGSNNGGSTWTTLDTRTGETFVGTGHRREFVCSDPGEYQTARLVVTENNGEAAGYVKITELEIRA